MAVIFVMFLLSTIPVVAREVHLSYSHWCVEALIHICLSVYLFQSLLFYELCEQCHLFYFVYTLCFLASDFV